jgi:hypothetical protein
MNIKNMLPCWMTRTKHDCAPTIDAAEQGGNVIGVQSGRQAPVARTPARPRRPDTDSGLSKPDLSRDCTLGGVRFISPKTAGRKKDDALQELALHENASVVQALKQSMALIGPVQTDTARPGLGLLVDDAVHQWEQTRLATHAPHAFNTPLPVALIDSSRPDQSLPSSLQPTPGAMPSDTALPGLGLLVDDAVRQSGLADMPADAHDPIDTLLPFAFVDTVQADDSGVMSTLSNWLMQEASGSSSGSSYYSATERSLDSPTGSVSPTADPSSPGETDSAASSPRTADLVSSGDPGQPERPVAPGREARGQRFMTRDEKLGELRRMLEQQLGKKPVVQIARPQPSQQPSAAHDDFPGFDPHQAS